MESSSRRVIDLARSPILYHPGGYRAHVLERCLFVDVTSDFPVIFFDRQAVLRSFQVSPTEFGR
jgi:hypothetical protein